MIIKQAQEGGHKVALLCQPAVWVTLEQQMHGIVFRPLDSKSNLVTQKQEIDRFKQRNDIVLQLSMKFARAVSLSCASVLIVLNDGQVRPAEQLQQSGRIVRLDQTKNAMVFFVSGEKITSLLQTQAEVLIPFLFRKAHMLPTVHRECAATFGARQRHVRRSSGKFRRSHPGFGSSETPFGGLRENHPRVGVSESKRRRRSRKDQRGCRNK